MIKSSKPTPWRRNDFVCPAELNAELIKRTHNATLEKAYIERDNLCRMVNKTKLVVNSALQRLVKGI